VRERSMGMVFDIATENEREPRALATQEDQA
jgi:hypothetical protein